MGHKVSDGKSYVAVATAAVTVGDPVEEDGVFGFADTDAAIGDNFSISIGQEEREVALPAKAGGWVVGEEVFWDGSTFTAVGTDRLVGRVTRAVPAAGGTGWMLVAADAWARS